MPQEQKKPKLLTLVDEGTNDTLKIEWDYDDDPSPEDIDFLFAQAKPQAEKPPTSEIESRRSLLPGALREQLAGMEVTDPRKLERELAQAGTTEQPELAMATPMEAARAGFSPVEKAITGVAEPVIAGVERFGAGVRALQRPTSGSDILRGAADVAVGALETGISSIPAMAAVNAGMAVGGEEAVKAGGELISGVSSLVADVVSPELDKKILEAVSKATGEKFTEKGLGYAVAGKFGLPVLVGAVLADATGGVADKILNDTSLSEEDRKRISDLVHHTAFFAGMGATSAAKGVVTGLERDIERGTSEGIRETGRDLARQQGEVPTEVESAIRARERTEPLPPQSSEIPSLEKPIPAVEEPSPILTEKGGLQDRTTRPTFREESQRSAQEVLTESERAAIPFEGKPETRHIVEPAGETGTVVREAELPKSFRDANEALAYGKAHPEKASELEARYKEMDAEAKSLMSDKKNNQKVVYLSSHANRFREAAEQARNPNEATPVEKSQAADAAKAKLAETAKAPKETEAAAPKPPATPSKPKVPVETAKPEAPKQSEPKVGDATRIMGADNIIADVKVVDGIRYELLNGKLKDDRGWIRTTDLESGNVITVKEHPTYTRAESEFKDAVKAASKSSEPPAEKVEKGTEKPPTKPVEIGKDYFAVYNGKVVPMEYIKEPKDRFKRAAQRIADNGAEGFVISPDGSVHEVTRGSKMAKRVTGEKAKEAIRLATGGGKPAAEPFLKETQTRIAREESLTKQPINELPKEVGEVIQSKAQEVLTELPGFRRQPGSRGVARERGLSGQKEAVGSYGMKQTLYYPDWWNRLGKSPKEIKTALEKIVEDAGKDTGKLVEDLKAILVEEATAGAVRGKGVTRLEIPPDEYYGRVIEAYRKGELDKFIEEQTSFPPPEAKPAKEPWEMTKGDFEKSGFYQHNILGTGEVPPEGFKSGKGPNAVPATQRTPRNIMEKRWGTKKGRDVFVVPKSAIEDSPNGPKVKSGWSPRPEDRISPRYDSQPLHEAIIEKARAEGKVIPPEVLKDYPELAVKFEKTKAGEQGVLIKEQAKYPRPDQGKRSNVPPEEQVKGTMFEKPKKPPSDSQSEIFSVASIAAYAGVDYLPIDDDAKKALKAILGLTTVVGIASVLSPRGKEILKDIERFAKRKGMPLSKSINEFFKSAEAKELSEGDRTALQKLAESPKVNIVATEVAKKAPKQTVKVKLAEAEKQTELDISKPQAQEFRQKARSAGIIDPQPIKGGRALPDRVQDTYIEPLDIFTDTIKSLTESNLRTAGEYVKRQPGGGELLVRDINRDYRESAQWAGKLERDWRIASKGLSDKEWKEFVSAADGGAKTTNPRVQKALDAWGKIRKEIADAAQDQGLEMIAWDKAKQDFVKVPFTPRENFFPHEFDMTEVRTQQGRARFIESFAEKLNLPMAEAEQVFNKWIRSRIEKKYGHLEYARNFDVPGWKQTKDVIPVYIERATRRIKQAEIYGKDYNIAQNWIEQILQRKGDYKAAQQLFDRVVGRERYDDAFSRLLIAVGQKANSWQTATKLTLLSLLNWTQLNNAGLVGGWRSLAKTLTRTITDKEQLRDFADRMGGILESTIQMHMKAENTLEGVGGKVLKLTGVTRQERILRSLSANAIADYFKREGRSLAKGKDNTRLRSTLQRKLNYLELGNIINLDKVAKQGGFSEKDLLDIGYEGARKTQFLSRPQDVQFLISDRRFKMFTQFKSFIVQQTKLLNDAVIQEARHGNLAPLAYLISMFPIAGEIAQDVRSFVTGRSRPDDLLERIVEDFATVGALGIIYDMFKQAARDPQGLISWMAGPTANEMSKIGYGISQAAQGNPVPLGRVAVGQIPIPIVQQQLQRMLKTEKKKSAYPPSF